MLKRDFVNASQEEILELLTSFQEAKPANLSANRFLNIVQLEPALTEEEFSSELRELIDDFNQKNGLKRINESWKEVSEKTAKWMIETFLSKDLAYKTALFEPKKVGWISQQFIFRVAQGNTVSKTGKGCRYFINGECGGPSLYTLDTKTEILGWMPVTSHTFDLAIAMVTPSHIGIIWGWDED